MPRTNRECHDRTQFDDEISQQVMPSVARCQCHARSNLVRGHIASVAYDRYTSDESDKHGLDLQRVLLVR